MPAQTENAVQPRDILSYRFLSEPQFGPAGGRGGARAAGRGDGGARPLVVRCRTADYDDNRYLSDLWLMEAGVAPAPVQLTSCGRVAAFAWEDAGHLLFISDRDPDDQKKREDGEEFAQFYRIGIHGGEATPAFRVEYAVGEFRVLGDGRVVFAATAHDASKEEREERKEASLTLINEVPIWSNGAGFVSDSRPALFLTDSEGEATRLTPDDLAVDAFEISEDDDTVLLAGYAYRGMRPARNDLYRLSLSSRDIERLSDDSPKEFGRPVFTGARTAVVPVNSMERYGLNENPDFAEIDIEAGTTRRLTERLDRSIGNSVGSDCRHGKPSPMRFAGGWLYFVSTEGLSSGLRRLDPASGRVEDVYLPAGSVDAFEIHDNTAVIVELRSDTLQELYAVPLSGSGVEAEARRLSSFNTAGVAGRELARPEHISVTRDDGTLIEGYVLAPPAAKSGEKRPGILAIHGGPKTVYGSVFVHEMQVLAAAGYYIFFCNPRGSDGRGNEFADIRGRYGTVDYEDIMAFTDAVLDAYSDRIDPDRLGVMGGSYGGFMTNWIIGSTGRFAAAVSQRSISSWLSMWGTSDIGFFFAEDQMAGDPWDGAEALWRQSPLRLARNASTPLLLIHSRADYRCWEVEAFQFLTAIRVHGGTARLALFDGENHELSRSGKPKPRIRRLEEILAWFGEYLG